MDPQKCLEILCSRARCEHGGKDSLKFCSQCDIDSTPTTADINEATSSSSSSSSSSSTNDSDDEFGELSKLELVNLFCALQSQRVHGYADYTTALDTLIEETRIGEYAALCGEMTARFSVISNKIITLQRKLRKIGLKDIADFIQKVMVNRYMYMRMTLSKYLCTYKEVFGDFHCKFTL